MTLPAILLLPFIGALAALACPARSGLARYVGAGALALSGALLAGLLARSATAPAGLWIAEWSAAWVPQLGIRFSLALDGLALVMSLLACAVGVAALLSTASAPRNDENRYTATLMILIFSIIGGFMAADVALFFVFYEVMLLPAYLLVLRWGAGRRARTALRFFLFTQTGGLLMLIAILGLYAQHARATGVYTFAYDDLMQTPLSEHVALLFACGFGLAFAVKLPLVPFHMWQPDAYTDAPVEGSILFSALMAKTAGFGLLRYVLPLFPGGAEAIAPVAITLGVLTILYASWLAFGQTDLKRLIAYSSAGHLGYVALGAFSMTELGRQGAIVQMVCHGLSVTGLFLVVDIVERRTGTRGIDALGGLWKSAPRTGAIAMVCVMATLGLPGLGNFIGEFLVLVGTFQNYPVAAAIAALGAVLSAAYSLRIMQKVFFGSASVPAMADEYRPVTLGVFAGLIALLVFLGVHPQSLLNITARAMPVVAAESAPTGDPR